MAVDIRNQPFKKGDKIGDDIEIIRLIGKGGQGFVYEGYNDFLEQSVAVEAIPNTQDSARNLRERARREAKILVKLNHPNILRVHTATVTQDRVVCIVMEILQGRSLRAMLHELNRITVDEALLIGEQIAEGVQAAHEKDTIHRDLKPENVYLEPGNLVKVFDFGIAKIVGLGAVTTQENLIQGTVQYMSPEHLQGRPVTFRSDVFALGCMLYELMSGSTPSVIGAESVTMHVAGWNQVMLMPPRLDLVTDNVPSYVGRAIQLMLAKEPAKRPATMAQVASELRALRARYADSFAHIPRELWHEGARSAAPLPKKAIPPMATTTAPDVAGAQSAEDSPADPVRPVFENPKDAAIAAQPLATATKSLPPMVQNELPEPRSRIAPLVARAMNPPMARSEPVTHEPSVVVNAGQASIRKPSPGNTRQQHAAQDSRDRSLVANADRIVAQQRTPQKSPGTGVPVTIATRKKLPSPKFPWRRLVPAVGAGSLVGAIALLVAVWSTDHKDAGADASARENATFVVPSKATAPATSTTAGPVPSGQGIASREPFTTASTPTNTSAALTRPPLVPPRHASQPVASVTPATTNGTPTVKPPSHKTKASPGKLPFSGSDLTF